MTAYLEKEINHGNFFAGGDYADWKARKDQKNRKRITSLHKDDYEKELLESDETLSLEKRAESLQEMLLLRNAQLSGMIEHVANFCNYSQQDDIVNYSKSLQWIWTYLEKQLINTTQ